jgi:hypothetical protein
MQTLVQNNVSHFIMSDETQVEMLDDRINIGNPLEVVLTTYTVHNTTLYKNVSPPSDWDGLKYLFNGTEWSLNPDFVDPTQQAGFPENVVWPEQPV